MSLTEERREKLLSDLKVCKEQELRAFINKKDPTSVYGLVTDGVSVIGVFFGEFGDMGYDPCFKYVPSTASGSGCKILASKDQLYKHFSKKEFDECVEEGRRLARIYKATLYSSYEGYMKRYGCQYEEV